MSFFRAEKQDSWEDVELPTTPGTPRAGGGYDAELHTLVGRLLGAVAILQKQVRAMRADIRGVTRRQTAGIAGIMGLIQIAVEAWRQVHH